MPIGDVECVVFDLDDTLWGQKANLHAAQDAMLAALADCYPSESKAMQSELKLHHADMMKSSQDGEYLAFLEEIRRSMSIHPDRKHDFTFLRTKTIERLTGSEAIAKEMMNVWLQKRNNPVFFPGALEALRALRDAGVQIGTLTDGNADGHVIEGLKDIVDFCVSSVEAGASKPARKAFALCETKSGCAPESMVMVGDNAQKDVAGARAAGWRAIWVQPSQNQSAVVGTAYDVMGCLALSVDEVKDMAHAIVGHVKEVEGILRSWAQDDAKSKEPPAKKIKVDE